MSRVALIAGAGRLPAEIAAVLDAPVVCAPAGVTPDGVAVEVVFHFERLVPFLRALGALGVDRVVLAGAVHRPRLDPALFDRDTAALVPDLLAAMQGGDDAALRFLIALIESFDLSVLGIADLAPQLLAGEGALTSRAPTAQELRDAERGRAVLAALAPADVGQGCAVVEGLCLGIEVLFGTDALLDDIARHRALREPRLGGVFIKRSKDRQDLRADLPTIGPATVSAVRAAGLTGVAVQAGHVLVLERAQTLALADEAGVAIWGAP